MNLNNFGENIDPAIIERGLEYYNSDRIKSLKKVNDNYYKAMIVGTDKYEVTVKMGSTIDIESINCTCPYDYGPYCKHEAAVLYALRDKLKNAIEFSNRGKAGSAQSRNSNVKGTEQQLKDDLTNQPKDVLVDFLMSLGQSNDLLRLQMEALFGSSGDEKDKWISVMRNCIKTAKGQYGFIEYGDCVYALEGVYDVIERTKAAVEHSELLLAADLSLAVLEEVLKMTQFADDSNGEINDVIETVEPLLTAAAKNSADSAQRELLFKKIFHELQKKIYDDWTDSRVFLLDLCVEAADTPRQRKSIEVYLDKLLHNEDMEWHTKYYSEQLTILRYHLLQKFDKKNAESFLFENRTYPSIRKLLIEKALHEKKYDKVEKLALEGEQCDKKRAGLVQQWKGIRFQVYECNNLTDKMQSLAYELLIGYGLFEYYKKLKALYTAEEWQQMYLKVVDAASAKYISHGLYEDILIEEKDWSRLLSVVQKLPYMILNYYKYLLNDHPSEVYAAFIQFILKEAENSNNRKDYKKVCSYLRLLKKIGGKEAAKNTIDELSGKYNNRRAFLDELGKL